MRTTVWMGLLAAAPAVLAAGGVEDLGWFAGCYERQGANATVEESWSRPAGGMMMGYARTVRGSKVVDYEFLRIAQDEAGRLTFFAMPARQAPAAFPVKSMSETEVVFENTEHDFPQRILYRKTADGLFARIEGMRNGQLRGSDFPMKRRACP